MCTIGMEFIPATVSNYLKNPKFIATWALSLAGLFFFCGPITAQSQNSATNSSQSEDRNAASDSTSQPSSRPNAARPAAGDATPAPPAANAGGAPVAHIYLQDRTSRFPQSCRMA